MRLWRDPLRRRWLLWATMGTLFLLVNVNRLSTAVLSENLMAAFGTTGAQLGTLHAVFFWVYAVMQIPTGVLADRVGPRVTAATGAVVMNLGVVWFALAESYLTATLARGLVGLGGSVIFVCILRFCANWFRADEFATMSGATFAVAGFGGVFATTPLALGVEAFGWRSTVGWIGAVGLVMAALVFALVRDSPVDAGFERIEGVPGQETLTNAQLKGHLAGVLRDRWIWVVSVMLFCTTGVNLTLFGLWGVPYVVQTYDVSVTTASTLTLLGGVGLMVGPPAIGWLSDRLESRVGLMVAGGACYTVCLGIIAVVGNPPLVVVGAVFLLAGVMLGTFVLGYSVVKDRHPSSASGISTGTANGAAFLGAAIFPTVMGWILDTYWTGELVGGVRVYTETGYRIAFGLATVAGVIAFVCTLWLYRHDGAATPESDGASLERVSGE
ncbi:MFS transporter [Natrinema salsiterrestre]|uniref:Lysosomal dipeptide transporter MFSD1 n=1 Tax=Natrinema salsiterrestre TaxID=2950540 RepID=A0A9Q4KWV1_9EURY|nr:MFS transporter [Natrinema salsiterrestre]MDF9744490.1 MFS transporter [Natrinema salsiterrestre]